MHADRVFAKFLAEKMQQLMDMHKPASVTVYMPAKLQKPFADSASKRLIDTVTVKLGNHVNATIPDVFAIVDALRKK